MKEKKKTQTELIYRTALSYASFKGNGSNINDVLLKKSSLQSIVDVLKNSTYG